VQSVIYLYKIYKNYIMHKYIINPCFCLILNHNGTLIVSAYIQTILDWLGSYTTVAVLGKFTFYMN